MMEGSEQCRLLEIYKLHSELADRVSQRRQIANRQYISIHVGLLVLVAAILRFGFGEIPVGGLLIVLGAFSGALSVAWAIEIRSYRQFNREKFRVLHDLESRLPYQFFQMEWDASLMPGDAGSRARKNNSYWRLTHVENGLPFIFAALYICAAIYSFCGQ